MVYDPEPGDSGKFLVPGDRDKKATAQIGRNQDNPSTRDSDDAIQSDSPQAQAARDIRAHENLTAAGKDPNVGGFAHPDPQMRDRSAKVDVKSRDDLRDDENTIPFTQDPKYANDQSSSNPVRTFMKGKGRKRYVAAALISTKGAT